MNYTVRLFKENKTWYAHYETLDLIADGKTQEEAQLHLLHIITSHIDFGHNLVEDNSEYPTIH